MHIAFYYYIVLLHLGPFLNMLGRAPGGRVYAVTAVAHLITLFLALGTFARAREYFRGGFGLLDTLVSAYLMWSILSIVLFYQSDHPSTIEAYIIGLHVYAAPILGYFSVKQLDEGQVERVLRFVVRLNLLMMVFGLYCYYFRPDFYSVYLRETVFMKTADMELWQLYARMQSYFGSTIVGILSGITLCLAVALKVSKPVLLSSIVLCICSALLSRQRGGMGAMAVGLVVLVMYAPWKKWVSVVSLFGGLILVSVVLGRFEEEHGSTIDQILSRFQDFDSTLTERRSGYQSGLGYLKDFPMGVGLGVSGASAEARGLSERGKVVDANYMRIAADLGVQGAAMFIAILVIGIFQSYGARQAYISAILFSYTVICVGTNIMDTHYVPHLFWMLLGIVKPPKKGASAKSAEISVSAPLLVDATPMPAAGRTAEG